MNRSSARQTIHETDICVIGSGITAALTAEKLAEEYDVAITVIEAGNDSDPLEQRARRRQRYLKYGESPWTDDHVDGMMADGMQSRSMQVGGLAMHWGGVTPRFSPEDFRVQSLYGIGDDWPISFDDLDPFYQEAEARMGVAGEQGPAEFDPRSQAYPMPALPLSYNLTQLKEWGERMGIAFWSQPSAKNSIAYDGRPVCCRNDTCFPICPIGAKYSPDFTWNRLRQAGKVDLVTRTVVRRLELEEGTDRIARAVAVNRDAPDEPVEFRARTFVIAGGYVWSSHLLLLSANERFPDGLANSSGLVGRYLAGHRNVSAYVELPLELFPGMSAQHSLMSHQFMAQQPGSYLRHDLRIWESTVGREPRLRDDDGALLLGDAMIGDWRSRARRGAARVRAYYDVLPGRDSRLTLDADSSTPWGDPNPKLEWQDHEGSRALRGETEETLKALLGEMARAGDGTILRTGMSDFQDHPCGGCRMSDDPARGVVDGWGRTWDHENLFVIGAPTCVTASCANGTLTFVALGLRSAAEIGRSL